MQINQMRKDIPARRSHQGARGFGVDAQSQLHRGARGLCQCGQYLALPAFPVRHKSRDARFGLRHFPTMAGVEHPRAKR